MQRIYLIGFMASGKTTIGKLLAEALNLDFIDLDFLIEKRFHKSVSQIFQQEGEKRFREIERNILQEVSEMENVVIATGGGTPCHFDNIKLMNRTGITFYLYFTPLALTQRLELTNKAKRPLIANLSKKQLIEYIEKVLPQRETYYNQADYKVQGTDDELVKQILNIVNKL